MDFLNLDFAMGTTALFKEAFKFKKYKAMPAFFAVVIGICQIPFVLVSFIIAAFIYLLGFIVKLLASVYEQIHNVVRREKDEVKAGAQTVIYLISWPFIFSSYVAIIISTFLLNILYIFLSLATFVWSLGGFRFHLLMSQADDIEKNVEGKYNKIVLVVFLCVLIFLLLLPVILTVVHYLKFPAPDRKYIFSQPAKILFKDMFNVLKLNFNKVSLVLELFTFLYTCFAFIPFPRLRKAKAVEEAPVVEEAPAVEETPVVEEAPAVEEAPIEEEASIEEAEPVADEINVQE